MKNSITSNSVICRNNELVFQDIDGEVVMMDNVNGSYFGLDAIASRIWELIISPMSVTELVEVLTTEFDVDAQQCEADVLDFLNNMVEKGLVIEANK
jgi:hypothetical protein